jgi:hypothetical protein
VNLLAPWFLAGLGAIAVPILVHLIHKERKDVQYFPSLMFLHRIPYQAVRRQKIRHWLLFLMRCAAIALLALAFARPFLTGRAAAAGLSGGGARDVVLLLDRSYSMGYDTRWTRALDSARAVVASLGNDDRAALVYFDGGAVAATELTADRSLLTTALDTIRPGAGVTRYAAAFKLAQRILGDTARARREVVLISDFQRAGWDGRDVPQLPGGATLHAINLADSATANVVVTAVDVRREPGADRDRVIVSARLTNRGGAAVAAHPVALAINDREVERRTIDLGANSAGSVEFATVPVPGGAARATVSAGPDALAADNIFHVAISRGQSIDVLVVEPAGARQGSSLFLARALEIGNRPAFNVTIIAAPRFNRAMLDGMELLVLNDAAIPAGEAGRGIVDWVRAGGGLFVVVGDRSAPRSWPSLADGLLPRPADAPTDRLADRGATLGYLDRSHPVFEPFNAPRSGDFSAARFFRYRAVTPTPSDRQLARFDDGSVALLERRLGAGRVLLWTSSLDGIWNDLPLQPVFLPFVHQAAKFTSGYREEPPSMTVGQVVDPALLLGDERRADGDSSASNANTAGSSASGYEVTTSSGVRERLVPDEMATSFELREPGFYTVRRAGSGNAAGAERVVAANVDRTESDLSALDVELVATAVLPRTSAADSGGTAAAAQDLTPELRERRQGGWWFLLAAALVLLASESLLSNRMSRIVR